MLMVILENLKIFFHPSLGWSQIGLYEPESAFGAFSDGFGPGSQHDARETLVFVPDAACIQAGIARMMQMLTVMDAKGIMLRYYCSVRRRNGPKWSMNSFRRRK